MKINHNTSKIVGTLFLVVFVTSIVGSGIVEELMYDDNVLTVASNKKALWITGMLIHFISVFGTIGIVIFMFPILKQKTYLLAIGYLVFRTIEALIFTFTEIQSLSILSLSELVKEASQINQATYLSITSVVQENRTWLYSVGMIFFCTGSFMFYYSMKKSEIIPNFLSLWGCIAAILALTITLVNLFGIDSPTAIKIVCYVPIASNEIILSIWLILKGFNKEKYHLIY